jgi:hydroxyacylglutathione hydrolase
MGRERRTNPFLRPDSPALQATVGLTGADPVTVFAEIRRRRNEF